MNKYELTIIARPNISDSEKSELKSEIEGFGNMEKWEEGGVKTLAYPIPKDGETFEKGMYFDADLELDERGVREIVRMLDTNNSVIRYLLVRSIEERNGIKQGKENK